jgi:spore coat polysaccharide biosynthesis protein SpsF
LKKKIVAIIQARTGSKRLPGKILKKVIGKTLLQHQLNQVKKSKLINQIVIATTKNEKDDKIYDVCKKEKIYCYRGSENNVLKRYFEAAKLCKADIVVRLTSDCPLIDSQIVDRTIKKFLVHSYDYVSNTCPSANATYADGMDVEVFSYSNLLKANKFCKNVLDREHVTHFFLKRPKKFKLFLLTLKKSYRKYRLTLDYKEDFILIKKILTFFLRNKIQISFKNIISYLDKNPEYIRINSMWNTDIT